MSGKIAIVTGAGSGIGRASALALLQAGYKVALAGRRKDALDETATLAGNNTPNAHGRCRPTSPSRTHRGAVRQGARRRSAGSICCSTMPAPARRRCRSRSCPSSSGCGVVAVNLTGSFLCTQEAIRIMKEQTPRGGRIINNGSISAHAPRPNSVAYTATKHAITGLTKSISLDGRAYDIACGQIDIGNAVTPMTERMTKGVPQANGTIVAEPRMDVRRGGRRRRLHGQPAARRQRAVHDGDGDQDAVRRERSARSANLWRRQRL